MTLTNSVEEPFGAVNNTNAVKTVRSVSQPTVYKAVEEHLCCDLDGESVVLSMTSGKYYGLNEVGARIWQLLQNQMTEAEIEAAILQEYDVDEATCRAAVSAFLKQMIDEQLVRRVEYATPQIS